MAGGRYSKARQQQRGKAARRARPALRAHPLFVPILTVWGMLLGGLVTLVLPPAAVMEAAANIGLAALGEMARFALAGLAAGALGVMMAILGKALSPKPQAVKNTPSIAAMAMRHVRTIDPASELGSPSFDAPVESMPFSSAQHRPEPASAPAPAPAPEPVALADTAPAAPAPPLALDLAGFAALPGRNAVWVEGPVTLAEPVAAAPAPEASPAPAATPAPTPVAEPAPIRRPAPPRPASPSAIERLRAVPTSELSLVQMVERFAAALHEHQSAPAGSAGLAARDAALAEALKALAALSHDSDGPTRSEPLRTALGRLQELRGAA